MRRSTLWLNWLTKSMTLVAGAVLLIMTGLTLADVSLRFFGKPILGAYELVAFMGVFVFAFVLPGASLNKVHVYVDLVVEKLPVRWWRTFRIMTRFVVFLMFLFASWYFMLMAKEFVETNTVTQSLRVPFYPVVFALAAGCAVQCLVSINEILFDEKKEGNNE